MLARLDPQSEIERASLVEAGTDLQEILDVISLVGSEDTFFAATGISGGTFLAGVDYTGDGAITHSLVMRGRSGTVRHVRSRHSFQKLMRYSAIAYD